MANKPVNYFKLGLFVIGGLGFLILLLYVIGKNQNLFGNSFLLKARFENVHGLTKGNNVRLAGIDAGTVKEIKVLSDTCIEVTLLIKDGMKGFIRKNATVTIGTDGLMGNKLVNIESARQAASLVEEGDVLAGEPGTDTEQMLKVLSKTNTDVAAIASELKKTVERINHSQGLWKILEDETLPVNIRQSLARIRSASAYMSQSMATLNIIVDDVNQGKGSLGKLLKDSAIAVQISEAVEKIKGVGVRADTLTVHVTALVAAIGQDISEGKGTVNAALKNKEWVQRIGSILQNLEADTQSFNEVMGAIKNSFLFRGYFRKLERQKREEAAAAALSSRHNE